MSTPSASAPRYRNPVAPWDMPDPDVIPLAEGGYALVASSFDRRPGLPLWWSADLVTWEPVGHAGGWQPLVHPSGGVWAPAIREHHGRLWITWADPDRGVYAVDAPTLAGPWSAPRLLIPGPGPIDPCPFWDDDGRTWIVHGWARSRAGFANRLDLVEVDAELTTVRGASRVVVDGDTVPGCTVLEGPKLHRRKDEYWLLAPAGGVEDGWQYAFRAAHLSGPWEHRIVLAQGGAATNGPHQGAWVEGVGGEEWFVHFQHTPRHGRILHLQPLTWGADGWPLIGAAVAGGPAEPVDAWTHPTPRPGTRPGAASPPGRWHGRGADPRDLLEAGTVGLRLRPGGVLAAPLERSAVGVSVELRAGVGALILTGAASHGVVVVPPGCETRESVGDLTVHRAAAPCRLTLTIGDDAARFLVDGAPVGEAFPLIPSQWTGLEFGLSSCGPGLAVFGEVTVEHA